MTSIYAFTSSTGLKSTPGYPILQLINETKPKTYVQYVQYVSTVRTVRKYSTYST